MYITFSYLQKDKKIKSIIKETLLIENRKKLPFVENKYNLEEAKNHILNLETVMQEQKLTDMKLNIDIHDDKGIINNNGATYSFTNVDLSIQNEFIKLDELIEKELYKDTDENMTLEQRHINESIFKILNDLTEQNYEPNKSLEPWERPIFIDKEKEDETRLIVGESLEDKGNLNESEKKSEYDYSYDDIENEFSLDEDLEVDEIDASDNDLNFTRNRPVSLPNYDKYISNKMLVDKVEMINQAELEKSANLLNLLGKLKNVVVNLEIEEDAQILGKQLHYEKDIEKIPHVFESVKQEVFEKNQGKLIEIFDRITGYDVEEIAGKNIAEEVLEMHKQMDELVRKYDQDCDLKHEKYLTDQEEQEQKEIENTVSEIKLKFQKKIEHEKETTDQRKENYHNKITMQAEKTAEELLNKEKKRLLSKDVEVLEKEKTKIDNESFNEINKLFNDAINLIEDKMIEITQEVQEKIPTFEEKLETKKQAEKSEAERIKAERLEKKAKEIDERKLRVKEEELALKKKEIELQEEKNREGRDQVVIMPSQNDSMSDQVIVELIKELKKENPIIHETKQGKNVNKWIIGCMTSIGLLLGGGLVTAKNAVTNQSAQVSAQESTSSYVVESSQSQEESLQKLLLNKEFNRAIEKFNDKESISQMQEYLYLHGEKDALRKLNEEYPTNEGKLNEALLEKDHEKVIEIYESLSEENKIELNEAQKSAIKSSYYALDKKEKAKGI